VWRPDDDPVRPGYDFVDWFADMCASVLYVFGTPIIQDTTIFAGWKKKD
jgi:uncharacterized repeat protein (TIGR02543 family)